MARRVTLDQLAAMAARGFEGVHHQMTGFRQELTGFRQELTGFHQELTGFREELIGFREELTGFREELTGFREELTGFREELDGFHGELKDLQEEGREGFASVRAVLTDHSNRLDRIEGKLDSVVGLVGDHEVRIRVLEKGRGPQP